MTVPAGPGTVWRGLQGHDRCVDGGRYEQPEPAGFDLTRINADPRIPSAATLG